MPLLLHPDGMTVDLPDGRVVIGTEPTCELVLAEATLAPRALELTTGVHGDALIKPLMPMCLDGQSLSAGTVLKDGARLRMGHLLLVFLSKRPEALPQSTVTARFLGSPGTLSVLPALTAAGLLAGVGDRHFAGHFGHVPFSEVLLLLWRQGRTGLLSLILPDGHAHVHIERGEPVAAHTDDHRGQPALLSLAGRRSGVFQFTDNRISIVRELTSPFGLLLAELIRRDLAGRG